MAITITAGAYVMTPDQITGYSTTRESGNIEHPRLGSEVVDITRRPVKLRKGTLRLVFASESAASTAISRHITEPTFVLAASDHALANMKYVVVGEISPEYDADSDQWAVQIGYREVP